jgi:hypothetical protein
MFSDPCTSQYPAATAASHGLATVATAERGPFRIGELMPQTLARYGIAADEPVRPAPCLAMKPVRLGERSLARLPR